LKLFRLEIEKNNITENINKINFGYLEIKLETSFDISVIWFVSPSYPCVDGLSLPQVQFVFVSAQT